MNQPITKPSFAKINLFLHITGKRPDGYHNLQTVFRLINFADILTFCQTNQQISDNLPVFLHSNQNITDNPADNLIIKASIALLNFAKNHQKLSQQTLAQLPIIQITLDKKIPMGAGLGGGSSNCATALMTLNDIWQLQLTTDELHQIGATLGADVPIFIFGKDAIAEGIGEILTPIDLPSQRFLLLMPNVHINTKLLFGNDTLQRGCTAFSHEFLGQHSDEFTDKLSDNFGNVFEPIVKNLSTEVKTALAFLQNLANTTTDTTPRMTGTGSCVFLPIPFNISDSQIITWQQQAPCPSILVKSL
ncbi:4-(cytidine 5'-diphospho)-2-C-methyl-D-erythritol kinase [Faucicola mancuniensis]|uniref:4-(cytidine 5'-diphospho)-2-C-methyl-D-erythritol kinase n=1 Tax=Faucicola mancuniensis TaxID=1309795 RepID=UPI003977DE6D